LVHQPLQTVGQRLQASRQARGLTLDAVTRATRLTKHVVTALEDDRFSDLAAPVYVRGFIRIYGQLLELDTDALLEAYEQQQAPAVPLRLDDLPPLEVVEPASRLPGYLRDTRAPNRSLSAAQLFLLTATALIVTVFLWSVNRKRPAQVAQPTPQLAPATAIGPDAEPAAASPGGRKPAAPASQPPPRRR
jgi:cytoskeletal protein RodZ